MSITTETFTRVDTLIMADSHVVTSAAMDTEEARMAVTINDSITMATTRRPIHQATLHDAIHVSPLATTIPIYPTMTTRIHTLLVISFREDATRPRGAWDRVARSSTHGHVTTSYTGTDIRCAN